MFCPKCGNLIARRQRLPRQVRNPAGCSRGRRAADLAGRCPRRLLSPTRLRRARRHLPQPPRRPPWRWRPPCSRPRPSSSRCCRGSRSTPWCRPPRATRAASRPCWGPAMAPSPSTSPTPCWPSSFAGAFGDYASLYGALGGEGAGAASALVGGAAWAACCCGSPASSCSPWARCASRGEAAGAPSWPAPSPWPSAPAFAGCRLLYGIAGPRRSR